MNQKREMKMSEETQKDFDLNEEYTSNIFCKISLERLKERFDGWLDWNMNLLEKEPEFHIKEEDRTLYIKVTEEGGKDFMNDGTEYYMVLQSLKDEVELKDEIEKEKQYNKEHGVLVRETFPFPTGEKE